MSPTEYDALIAVKFEPKMKMTLRKVLFSIFPVIFLKIKLNRAPLNHIN